jgi:hypothetical protein
MSLDGCITGPNAGAGHGSATVGTPRIAPMSARSTREAVLGDDQQRRLAGDLGEQVERRLSTSDRRTSVSAPRPRSGPASARAATGMLRPGVTRVLGFRASAASSSVAASTYVVD